MFTVPKLVTGTRPINKERTFSGQHFRRNYVCIKFMTSPQLLFVFLFPYPKGQKRDPITKNPSLIVIRLSIKRDM